MRDIFFPHGLMTIGDVQRIMEAWAPRELAWERDNVGIQCGSTRTAVRTILATLDVTDEVIREAISKKANLIISHHPLFFHPLKRLSPDERVGRLIETLTKHSIALYSAHTNLDFASDGVSCALAERLGITDIDVLAPDQHHLKKIVVFVPVDHAEKVLAAMADAGAGSIGNYESCAFGAEGVGAFKPLRGARPFIGNANKLEKVRETRLEMIVPQWKLDHVIRAMRAAHPYEEVAHDIYDLANADPACGAGAIGHLRRAMSPANFLTTVRRRLGSPAVRYRPGEGRRSIRRVAVCGGSGSDLLQTAIQRGADAFVTADITYHRFEECDGRILLVDAGHHETERPILQKIVARLRREILRRNGSDHVHVYASRKSKNPVYYYPS